MDFSLSGGKQLDASPEEKVSELKAASTQQFEDNLEAL